MLSVELNSLETGVLLSDYDRWSCKKL